MKKIMTVLLWLGLATGVSAETMVMVSPVNDATLIAAFTKAYKDAGFDLKVEILPPARGFTMLDNGEASIVLAAESAIKTTFKTKPVLIGLGDSPLTRAAIVAWVRKGDEAKFKDRASWASARVGHILGTPISKSMADQTGSKTLVESNSYENAMNMLAGSRFDIVFMLDGVLDSFVGTNKNLAKLPDPAAVVAYWHLLPTKYAGTPAEKKLREAFVKNQAEIDTALKSFLNHK